MRVLDFPHLIVPTELAGSILHPLPRAVFIASSDAKDIRTGRTRNEYASLGGAHVNPITVKFQGAVDRLPTARDLQE
jgi:hypothetical protein